MAHLFSLSSAPMIPMQWGFEDEFGERVIDLAATLGVSS